MHLIIQATSGIPIGRQIADGVKAKIASGELKADDQLPTVRKLAQQLSVNANTVVRAYDQLQRDGVIYKRQGQGTFIASVERPVDAAEAERLLAEVANKLAIEGLRLGLGKGQIVEVLSHAIDQIRQQGK